MKIIDISLKIHPGMVVYPNNPKVSWRWQRTPHTWISQLSLGTHTGTHVDVPRHVFRNGRGVDKIPLKLFFGPCRVLDLRLVKRAINISDLKRFGIKKGERILVKTRNSRRGYKRFFNDYIYLEGDAAEYLSKKRIALFGIDYFSVKQRGSPDNRPHTALLRRGIPIIEGLDLSRAKAGRYLFIGLPLNFRGRDGAPCRAMLVSGR